uniref:Sulfotransferase n=1 Tax=Tetraodon nigroviridis TaxID=99883 RepID=H3BXF7_TETNG
SKWRAAFNFGHLKAQSKLSVFFTMILLFTYLFYCLSGYCDSVPRPVCDQKKSFQAKLILNDGHDASSQQQQPDARNSSHGPGLREQLSGWSPSNNLSIANNFGSKKFPQAIIIGVKKGGTRALLEFLRIHPDVRAVGSEPHFFDRFYDRGLEWYRDLLTSFTLNGQQEVLSPVFAVSNDKPQPPHSSRHTQTHLICLLPSPRYKAKLTANKTRKRGLSRFKIKKVENNMSDFISISFTAALSRLVSDYLCVLDSFFPNSNCIKAVSASMHESDASHTGWSAHHGGLKRVVTDKHFYFNQTKGFPCKKPEGSSRPRCLGKSKGRPHPQIPSEVLLRLRDFYRPFNLKFYQMTGQNFAWD